MEMIHTKSPDMPRLFDRNSKLHEPLGDSFTMHLCSQLAQLAEAFVSSIRFAGNGANECDDIAQAHKAKVYNKSTYKRRNNRNFPFTKQRQTQTNRLGPFCLHLEGLRSRLIEL